MLNLTKHTYVKVTNEHTNKDKQHRGEIKISMDILLHTGEKRQDVYVPLTFALFQAWNNHILFAQVLAERTFYTFFCKCSHWHTTAFTILILSGLLLQPGKQETEIFPLNS